MVPVCLICSPGSSSSPVCFFGSATLSVDRFLSRHFASSGFAINSKESHMVV